jgi:hypothetical protein
LLGAAALALAVIGGCGKSAAEKAMDQVSADCLGLIGKSVGEAGALLQSGVALQPVCAPNLAPLPSDTCGPASAQNPLCEIFWVWQVSDSSACNGGCCVCVVRTPQASFDANNTTAPVCASNFLRGESC